MKIESRFIKDLKLDPNNARKHDQRNLDAIKTSLDTFGQRKPIVITKDGTIIAGNGTVTAAKALQWLTIDVVVVPENWDAEKVKAFALADNRSAELATWDENVLASQLIDLEIEGWDIALLGFDKKEEEQLPEEGDADTFELPTVFGIVVECMNEDEQTQLLNRFINEGLNVRALM